MAYGHEPVRALDPAVRASALDDRRQSHGAPIRVGLDAFGGRPGQDDPHEYVAEYASEAIARSEDWYAPRQVNDYHLDDHNVLTFTSPDRTRSAENNTVHAQVFPARKAGPAVLILPNWNAKWHGQVALCHWLQRIGITAVKMSLPYHDRRMAEGHERADQLVGPNIGTDPSGESSGGTGRAGLPRLARAAGLRSLGNLLGTSIGSSVGYITLGP